ncbi:MAG TPA: DNA cytosine methyltransferase [Methylophilus sp.]|uniref:DNA cytosine methyltransferase n=1 Tax=Methylophilus sp. TaxID=29541 RepID=UPI002C6FABD8|nr:DNA cytosine methyltransferase [Methylophilus sp.]HSH86875.1 DNA cytosine methyltransferase [Methylophilus sp.]
MPWKKEITRRLCLHELALFAGAGGGILGGKLLGWRTICAVERDAYAAQVLAQRQNDGILEAFPIWSDVTTFDGRPWRGLVDVISGGFPCQDISAAGKGAGITGARSGMWKEMARIVSEVQPRFVFVENSPMLTIRGLGVVLGDLAAMGFDAEWGVLSAADVGANHKRERIWILGHSRCVGWIKGRHVNREYDRAIVGTDGQYAHALANTTRSRNRKLSECEQGCKRCEQGHCPNADRCGEKVPNTNRQRQRQQGIISCKSGSEEWEKQGERPLGPYGDGLKWWSIEPDVGRVADGVAFRVDRLKGIGNGQVPLCAATAFQLLKARLVS